MRIFVFESTTARIGSSGSEENASPTESLQQEGLAMLAAIASDLLAIPDTEVSLLCDRRIGIDALPAEADLVSIESTEQLEDEFQKACADADGVILIAPEIDEELAMWARRGTEQGAYLFGPDVSFIELASDKWKTYQRLQAASINTPKSILASDVKSVQPFSPDQPWIIKPRFGAGSLGIRRFENDRDETPMDRLADSFDENHLLQPFADGMPVSVTYLLGPQQRIRFPATEQLAKPTSSFEYAGSRGPLGKDLDERVARLSDRVVEAFPQCVGYIGIDLILGRNPNGDDDVVLEVNPRATSSYLLLRQLTHPNIASLWLEIVAGDEVHYAFSGKEKTYLIEQANQAFTESEPPFNASHKSNRITNTKTLNEAS